MMMTGSSRVNTFEDIRQLSAESSYYYVQGTGSPGALRT